MQNNPRKGWTKKNRGSAGDKKRNLEKEKERLAEKQREKNLLSSSRTTRRQKEKLETSISQTQFPCIENSQSKKKKTKSTPLSDFVPKETDKLTNVEPQSLQSIENKISETPQKTEETQVAKVSKNKYPTTKFSNHIASQEEKISQSISGDQDLKKATNKASMEKEAPNNNNQSTNKEVETNSSLLEPEVVSTKKEPCIPSKYLNSSLGSLFKQALPLSQQLSKTSPGGIMRPRGPPPRPLFTPAQPPTD